MTYGEGIQQREVTLPLGETPWSIHDINGDYLLFASPDCTNAIAERALRLAKEPDFTGLTLLGDGGLSDVFGDGAIAYKKAIGADLANVGVGSLGISEAVRTGLESIPEDARTIADKPVTAVQAFAAVYPRPHKLRSGYCTPVWAMQQVEGARPPRYFSPEEQDEHSDLLLKVALEQGASKGILFLDTYFKNYVVAPDGGSITKIDTSMEYNADTMISAAYGVSATNAS